MTLLTIRILLTLSVCLFSTLCLAQNTFADNLSFHTSVTKLDNDESNSIIKQQSTPLKMLAKPSITDHLTSSDKKTVADLLNQPTVQVESSPKSSEAVSSPQVGKHVMANMNASSMILSLLMVLVLIIICAFVLKRFNLVHQGASQLKVVANLSLGAKERVMVVQAGEQQFLLGVTSQHVNLLEKLSVPLSAKTQVTANLPKGIASLLSSKKVITDNKK